MRAIKAQKHLYNLNEAKVLLLNLVLLTEIIQYKKINVLIKKSHLVMPTIQY